MSDDLALALDLETSGLPVDGNPLGHIQYPWMLQVSAILFDLNGRETDALKVNVKAEGRSVTGGATAVHGVSTREASKRGVSEISALGIICGMAAQARWLVGFSVRFDLNICESTLIRLGKSTRMLVRPGLEVIDLIGPAANFCKIPGTHESGGYKWPSLDVACHLLLGEEPSGAPHDALHDARRSKLLFLNLLSRGGVVLKGAEAA